jgi:hypothetical protein
MILPTKHISTERSLLGIGATLLERLDQPRTISGLWERARVIPEVVSFERFVLGLDLLYAIGAIELVDGLVRRRQS